MYLWWSLWTLYLLACQVTVTAGLSSPLSYMWLVLKAHKWDHVSPLLRTLHWLPIPACIEHKLSTLCNSPLSDTAPVDLSDLLRVYSPSRQLHSPSHSRTLHIPHIKIKTSGHRSISYTIPSVWNSLPHEIWHSQSTTAFKTALRLICSNPTSAR